VSDGPEVALNWLFPDLNFFDSAQCLMVRRWRLIGYFPVLYNPLGGACRSDEAAVGPELGGVAAALVRWLIHRAKAPSLTLHQAVRGHADTTTSSSSSSAAAAAQPHGGATPVLPRPYFADEGTWCYQVLGGS
jgi:hypothetical protein